MFEIIGMIVIGIGAVAVGIALLVLAVKVALVLLPIAIVVAIVFVCCSDKGEEWLHRSRTDSPKIERLVKWRDEAQREFHEEILSLTRQKSEVNMAAVRPELDSAISVVVRAFCTVVGDDDFLPLITSANDYDGHKSGSAHYSGAAVDFRIKDIKSREARRELVRMIREDLDDRFMVLHEDIGTGNEHLHLQLRKGVFDPNVVWK